MLYFLKIGWVLFLRVTGCQEERRGRDSNPRYTCVHTGFRDRPDRPLRHLSEGLHGGSDP